MNTRFVHEVELFKFKIYKRFTLIISNVLNLIQYLPSLIIYNNQQIIAKLPTNVAIEW